MAGKLPYVIQPGSILKIFGKIKDAKTPDRFTYDFLETKLGCKGGNYKQFIPLAKKMGLINSDGTPTDLYKSYKNPSSSGASVALAMKNLYKEIFDRNEYANELNRDQLKGLVLEISGLEPKSRVVQLVCSTFENLKTLSDFDRKLDVQEKGETTHAVVDEPGDEEGVGIGDLRLAYNINLVLPKTDDPAVFNAIFKSLRENLLKK